MRLVATKEHAGLMARQTCSISATPSTQSTFRRDFHVPQHYRVNINANWGVPRIKLRRANNYSFQKCDNHSCSGPQVAGPHGTFTKFDPLESAGRNSHRSAVSRTSRTSEPFDLDGESSLPSELVETRVNWFSAFWRFTRPHTIIGSGLGVTSVSLLACQGVSDVNFKFAIGLLKAVIPALCMNVYIVGLNQLYDIDIDKVNKPNLPLASGEFSVATGIILVTFFAAVSVGMGFYVESPPLLWALLVSLVLGTAYSADLPFLRWKRSAVAAAACILAVRALVVQLGFYLHMQVSILGRAANFPKPLWFATGFMCFFSVVIALAKDIPDVRGDKEFGIRSFSVRLGQKRVFWMCVTLLEAAYLVAIITGLTAPTLASKVITATGHAIMAGILWERSDSVDLTSKAAITSWYMFIWKLFYAEYLLIPFMR
ncbi:probable homogentisate phytyltransferase 1, chloroplastic [Physcomitrium patens]|uniref:Uncharacterized protein n=1 Tax=Physcomitrium patens TaxID=3218 RepID=A0A7I4BJM5_PHYPA|nr:probable homogentisate phytyltransferase 1, chloroplastic [Physcomitrium patens]|eukprot:XP_024402099.1 probable homogentisate phytyltransferase 1, chloroplastic [Physcomitrella patens]